MMMSQFSNLKTLHIARLSVTATNSSVIPSQIAHLLQSLPAPEKLETVVVKPQFVGEPPQSDGFDWLGAIDTELDRRPFERLKTIVVQAQIYKRPGIGEVLYPFMLREAVFPLIEKTLPRFIARGGTIQVDVDVWVPPEPSRQPGLVTTSMPRPSTWA